MSETTTEAAPPPEEAAVIADPAPQDAAPPPPAHEEPVPPIPEPTIEELQKKLHAMEKKEKRFEALTRKSMDATRDRDAAVARAKIAEDLLAEKNGNSPTGTSPEAAIDAAAERKIAERRFDDRRRAVINGGVKEFGENSWNEKTQAIAAFGAIENPTFMSALVELDNAPALVAALAEDSGELESLLSLPPVALAARMGIMAAKLDTPATPAATPKISAAPRPVAPVNGRASPVPSVYDDKISMREYAKMRSKSAPRSLGGRGEA